MAITRKLFRPPLKLEDGTRLMCGDHALMALTGKTPEQCWRSMANAGIDLKVSHRSGLYLHEIVTCLNHMGFSAKRIFINHLYDGTKPPTFAKWIRERRGLETKKTYLLMTTNHFMLVSGNRFSDNHAGECHVDDAPHKRSRILSVMEIKGK